MLCERCELLLRREAVPYPFGERAPWAGGRKRANACSPWASPAFAPRKVSHWRQAAMAPPLGRGSLAHCVGERGQLKTVRGTQTRRKKAVVVAGEPAVEPESDFPEKLVGI